MPKPTKKSPPRSEPRTAENYLIREKIELRAYQIYVERGGVRGQDVEDWLQAEHELVKKYEQMGLKAKATAA